MRSEFVAAMVSIAAALAMFGGDAFPPVARSRLADEILKNTTRTINACAAASFPNGMDDDEVGLWWMRPRDPDHFRYIQNVMPDREFKQMFRVSRRVFQKICDDIGPAMRRRNTKWRDAIPVEKRVAIGLYYLAHQNVTFFQVHFSTMLGTHTVTQHST